MSNYLLANQSFVGNLFFKWLKKAIASCGVHSQAFNAHSATYPTFLMDEWRCMADNWDAGVSVKNPYEEPNNGKLHC